MYDNINVIPWPDNNVPIKRVETKKDFWILAKSENSAKFRFTKIQNCYENIGILHIFVKM
jgi:hypothetical protein